MRYSKTEAWETIKNLPLVSDISSQSLDNGKWLALRQIQYTDPIAECTRFWESCERNHAGKNFAADAVDAVDVISLMDLPWSGSENKQKCILLVCQFRPPVSRYTLEFCSGLIEADPNSQSVNEAVASCALRELREETGYTGEIREVCSSGTYKL